MFEALENAGASAIVGVAYADGYEAVQVIASHIANNATLVMAGLIAIVAIALVSLLAAVSISRATRSAITKKREIDEMARIIRETLPVFMEKKRDADEVTRMVLEALPTFIEIWDDSLNVIDCNQRTLDVFEISSKEDYINRYNEFAPAIQPSGRPSYKNAVGYVETALREGSSQFEWMHQKLSGEQLPMEVTCVCIPRNDRSIIVAYNHDLRPIKAAIKREREAEERIGFLLDAAPMACYLLNEEHKAIGCNLAAIELFVKEPGKPLIETYPAHGGFSQCEAQDCRTCKRRGLEKCFARKYLALNYRHTFPTYEQNKKEIRRLIGEFCDKALEAGAFKIEFSTAPLYGGETIPCEITIVPIRYQEKHAFAVYLRDLREERRRKTAEEESQAKTRFLAHMSHEIRTPMNAVIGMAELALRAEKIDAAREHILTVKQAGTNLLSIINDLLDISKVEKGKLEIVMTDYHFSSLLNDVISIIRVKIAAAHLHFVVNVDSNIPNALRGDEARLRQVLLNLLGNAVKYTDIGGFVSLRIYGKMNGKGAITLTIDVEDSGCGIKEDNIKTLFDEYARFDREKNKRAEGTGLGLAITWHIVKAMDGKIIVRSEYGRGSTFTVTLPQKAIEDKPFGRVNDAENKSVLIYERRSLYANSLVYTVDSLGVACAVASSDSDLLEKLIGGQYTFAFVSFDLYQKNADAINRPDVKTKIVILSEFGEVIPDKSRLVLAMPVHSRSVANVLNGGRENFSYQENSEFTVDFTAPDASVLVVDDILTNLQVVKGLMVPYGMQVTLCKTGGMAIEALKSNRFDVVFMDHLMPDMDGTETTAQIRALGKEDGYFAQVPIVVLTANVVSGMREFFLENGFSDFMSKPVDVVKLNSILVKWIPEEKKIKLATREEANMAP